MTDELKKKYTYNPVAQVQYDTLELSHSGFSQSYYLVRANEDLTLGGQLYTATGFDFTLPEKGGNQQDLQVTINNVGSNIILELESALNNADEAIGVVYRSFLSDDPTTVQFSLTLNLQEVTLNAYTISGRATNINLFDSVFPRQRFDSWKFKGLTI